MKYKSIVLDKVLSAEKWKSTAKIRRETEKIAKKNINWYTVHYLLQDLLKDGRVEIIKAENVTLWRKSK